MASLTDEKRRCTVRPHKYRYHLPSEQFKDRVRGEMLTAWGVAEAQELGILDTLKSSCGHQLSLIEMGMGPRDLATTTKQLLPALTSPDLPANEPVRARLFGES